MNYKNSSEKIAYFSALCFFLSAVEYAIPKPVPFFRIGFANVPLMLSLAVFSRKETFVLCISKIFFQAVISGTFFSYIFIFSFAGTFASVCIMMIVYSLFANKNIVSWVGVCAAGAFANNAIQLLLSYHFIFGEGTRLIAPWILLVSLISSVLLGFFSNYFCRKSSWWKNKVFIADGFFCSGNESTKDGSCYENRIDFFSALLSAAAVFALVVFNDVFISAVIFVFFLILVFVKGKKVKVMPSVFLICSITFFELLVPNGKIIFEIQSLRITQGALFLGLNRALRLCSFVFISKYFMLSNFILPGKIGSFFNRVMVHYSLLTSSKLNLKRGRFIESLDSVLCKIN